MQKTVDIRREPRIFAENRRKPQIGVRDLSSVTFSSALFLVFSRDSEGLAWRIILVQ